MAGTTDTDMDFDYLRESGPRFRRLADIYGADAQSSESEGEVQQGGVHVHDSMPGESWC